MKQTRVLVQDCRYSLRGPTLLTTYCLTFFCSCPPTPSISSAVSWSIFVYVRQRGSLWAIGSWTSCFRFRRGLTRSRSAPASMSATAAAPCPDSIARWRGVFPARSAPFRRVFGRPSGGFNRIWRKDVEPVVAARWRGNWEARSLALIWDGRSADVGPTNGGKGGEGGGEGEGGGGRRSTIDGGVSWEGWGSGSG